MPLIRIFCANCFVCNYTPFYVVRLEVWSKKSKSRCTSFYRIARHAAGSRVVYGPFVQKTVLRIYFLPKREHLFRPAADARRALVLDGVPPGIWQAGRGSMDCFYLFQEKLLIEQNAQEEAGGDRHQHPAGCSLHTAAAQGAPQRYAGRALSD